ncbi:MAG: hypothetical protein MUO67_15595, partial [Anaerolineales bacterium]|nr:hypothetical protein [Anaerolineales bacterium]
RRCERVGGCPDEELGWRFYRPAVIQAAPLHHIAHHPDQVDRIQVKYVLGVGMIPPASVVSTQAQYVTDPQRSRAQKFRLDRQPVAVAARHLRYRLDTMPHQQTADRNAGHAHAGSLVVGHIDRVGILFQGLGIPLDGFQVNPAWRRKLCCYRKVAIFEYPRQVAGGWIGFEVSCRVDGLPPERIQASSRTRW